MASCCARELFEIRGETDQLNRELQGASTR
jgi:hypothetical protein